MRRTLARPMPVPWKSSMRCRRWNTPNSLCTYSILKPAPLSATRNTVSLSVSLASMAMIAGFFWPVNLTAFDSRLNTASCRKVGSATIWGSSPSCHSIARPAVSGASLLIDPFTRSFMFTVMGRSAARPICEKLRRSSTSLPARRAESLMFDKKAQPGIRCAVISRFHQQIRKSDNDTQGRTQIMRHRVGKGFQLFVGPAQFLGQFRHLFGPLEGDPQQGAAELQRQLDFARVPGRAGTVDGLAPGGKTGARGQGRRLRGRLFLAVGIAGPLDRLHQLRPEPQQIMLVDTGNRHGQQAAAAADEVGSIGVQRGQMIGVEQIGLAVHVQPVHQPPDLAFV